MTNTQELRAPRARRDERKDAPKRRKRDVAQWRAIIDNAAERGLSASEVARERGVTSQAVTHWLRTFQVTLTQKFRGPNFVHTYKPKFRCPDAWGLTDQQAQLVAILVDDGEVSNAVALERITSEETDDKILDVVLCNTRKKLKRFNVNIHRHWGRGLFLDPVQRKRLRAGAVTLKPSERTP